MNFSPQILISEHYYYEGAIVPPLA